MLRRLLELPCDDVQALATLARAEGYRFLDRLIEEWLAGKARFDGPGERLFAAFEGDRMIAIGGLHRDPYAGPDRIGRLRRFYVAPDRRRGRVGTDLLGAVLEGADRHFDVIRLRVPNAAAARFYEALGFAATDEPDTTHVLRVSSHRPPAG